MKFVVTRTSLWKDQKPCRDAVKKEVTLSKPNKGTIDVWIIEIRDLEDLMKFYNKYGNIVIRKSRYKELPVAIEIYDDLENKEA